MEGDRRIAGLVRFTIVVLVIYAPIETWASLPELWNPFYLVDLIGMVLLVSGVVRCRRGDAWRGVAVLVAGYAWLGANGWRAMFGRIEDLMAGGELTYGAAELCFVVCGTLVAIVGLARTLLLAFKLVPSMDRTA